MTDPRDAELVETVVARVLAVFLAVHRNDAHQVVSEMNALVGAMIEHKQALAEPASNEALRRAIARLGR